jgi:magnesium transporter
MDKPGAASPSGRSRRRRHPPVGTPPGTLAVDPAAPKPVLRVLAWGPQGLVDRKLDRPDEVAALREQHETIWLNVDGLGDAGVLQRLGELFGLHRLALEDVVNTNQRSKLEDYKEHAFLVVRTVNPGPQVDPEQISLFFGKGFVLSFQERAGDSFDAIRSRLRDPDGRLRTQGAGYVAYALLDAMVDAFFPVLEGIGDRLEACEERVIAAAVDARRLIADVHVLRRDLLLLRRAIWPLRDVANALVRGDCPHFTEAMRPYLRDVHDHVLRVLDLLENQRELAAALMELHLTTVSHRLNEIMKVLTIIATIFIPLTFIAGVYGMNFDYMPELRSPWGYPLCLLGMGILAGGMLVWFRRRRFLGAGRSRG